MRHTLLLPLVALLFLLFVSRSSARRNDRDEFDVCGVGMGAAGSFAAIKTLDEGESFVGFDLQDSIGGHCDTVRYKGPQGQDLWNEGGVIIFLNTTFANALGYGPFSIDSEAIIKRFAGNRSTIPEFFKGIPQYSLSADLAQFYGSNPPPTPPSAEFLRELARFTTLMNTTLKWMDTMIDVPSPLPVGLNASLNEWIFSNGFGPIYPIFIGPLIFGGFGDFDQLTAIDGLLQRTSSSLLYGTDEAWFSVDQGCDSIYRGMRKRIGEDSLLLGSRIESIERRRGGRYPVRISGRDADGDRFERRCKRLYMSIPPTIENLESIGLDVKDWEYDLFESVQTKYLFVGNYTATGFLNDQPQGFAFANVDPTSATGLPDFPNILVGFRKFDNGPVVLQAFSQGPISTEVMKAIVRSKLKAIVRSGAISGFDDLVVEIHVYNPHFSRQALGGKESPYRSLKRNQGRDHTFYFGSMPTTPNTVVTWNHVNSVINDFKRRH